MLVLACSRELVQVLEHSKVLELEQEHNKELVQVLEHSKEPVLVCSNDLAVAYVLVCSK